MGAVLSFAMTTKERGGGRMSAMFGEPGVHGDVRGGGFLFHDLRDAIEQKGKHCNRAVLSFSMTAKCGAGGMSARFGGELPAPRPPA